ncbi:sulfurtransferase complex subunit TusD [Candidatus Schneideria nysicola]|uniref:sulfurtransferase complex subunit TusD n=1 Tax=Candidatus Schneideria nysicola TaxID=1081631 RepID=UPI001CAA7C72|nr:sulfurtransferase complex subunit TusD [Candidatus Schneideria nysicola]UAJ65023.1 sulfurtransferase complex subunit TusD [Candidatus Schneideria nysicola]
MKILTYCIMVTGGVYGSQRSIHALQFSKALLKKQHLIKSIFFYQEGVYNAYQITSLDHNHIDLFNNWKALSKKYHIKLNVCISAAIRRGIIDKKKKDCYGNFIFSSLNTLIKDVLICDRFIQF